MDPCSSVAASLANDVLDAREAEAVEPSFGDIFSDILHNFRDLVGDDNMRYYFQPCKRVEFVVLVFLLFFGLDVCALPNIGFAGLLPLSMEVWAPVLSSSSFSTVMADVRSTDLMCLHWRCCLMRRLNDYSGVFFRGDVVTGLKLGRVALSPARRVGATSVLSGWVESSVARSLR